MNERIARLLIAGVLGVATILALSWFFRNFELATREEQSGYSQEARRNPLLAAERYLQRLGVEAHSLASTALWQQLPGSDDVLIIYRYQPPASAQRRAQLRQWIESGGHLIVEADRGLLVDEDTRGKPTGLLADLGVRLHEREIGDDDDELWTTLPVHFTAAAKPVEIAMYNRYYLEDSEEQASASVAFSEGYALLQYTVGDGLVTVVADNSFLSNQQLGRKDHALALALLVGMPAQGKVWLVHDVVMPSLFDLAWQRLPHALIAAAVALVLWLWYLGRRLGPLLPPAQAPRRDIGEHLSATAHYFWRLDHAHQLYARNRDQVLQAWLHKHYALRKLDHGSRCAWMAARAGLSPRAVERALAGEFGNEADFVEMSSCLQVLRAAV